MARRTTHRTVKRLRVTLANTEVAVRGYCAYANEANGLVYADPDGVTTLIPIGYFTEDVTGDGTATTVVDLFEEKRLDAWENDEAPNNVEASDLFSEVYAKDGKTVSTDDADGGSGGTRSIAGRVFLIEDGRVYVQAPR